MVQEFHVVRCCSCGTCQVHIVRKDNKFVCKICGEKQSVKKVYGKGSAKDCRVHVQKLNSYIARKDSAADLEAEAKTFAHPKDDLIECNTNGTLKNNRDFFELNVESPVVAFRSQQFATGHEVLEPFDGPAYSQLDGMDLMACGSSYDLQCTNIDDNHPRFELPSGQEWTNVESGLSFSHEAAMIYNESRSETASPLRTFHADKMENRKRFSNDCSFGTEVRVSTSSQSDEQKYECIAEPFPKKKRLEQNETFYVSSSKDKFLSMPETGSQQELLNVAAINDSATPQLNEKSKKLFSKYYDNEDLDIDSF
ncbi:uncharacterized protein LOC108679290 [Hyalella azteca]|uniref:Uncharacterized protein LOC108679290 n=1 Tax=Hyalella azteca TaxID=294128 RepID=A0A8B7PCH0_HYAAZ|nr:uncharacterized protein LOC108679290 [Hyalella azteca]